MTSSNPDPSAPSTSALSSSALSSSALSTPAPSTPAPRPDDPARRQAEVDQYLTLLSIGYYVTAALTALVGLFPLIHIAIGAAMLSGGIADTSPDEAWIARLVGSVFVLMAGLAIAFFFASAAVFFVAARRLPQRRGFVVSVVAAALACCFFPIGTVLGVLTFLLLFRDDVRPTFDAGA